MENFVHLHSRLLLINDDYDGLAGLFPINNPTMLLISFVILPGGFFAITFFHYVDYLCSKSLNIICKAKWMETNSPHFCLSWKLVIYFTFVYLFFSFQIYLFIYSFFLTKSDLRLPTAFLLDLLNTLLLYICSVSFFKIIILLLNFSFVSFTDFFSFT